MKHLIKHVWLLVCCAGMSHSAWASDIVVERFSLDNDLNVIVIPNHRIPAVSHMLWFPNGGADDPSGKSGLAHFHEHIMFKGTTNYPNGEFESIVARLGGDHNAFTTYDATGYYVNVPKEALPTIMRLEADRIRSIVPSDQDITNERQVILEERRMRVENNPKALFHEQLNAALFTHHPYGTPLIGWMHEMQQLSKQDVLKLHDTHYAASNATLVLAGDITVDTAKPLVERYYGGLATKPKGARNWNKEPPIRASKRLMMQHEQVNEPYWQRNYIAPSVGYGNIAHSVPLMVFTEWLGGSDTSYLYQQLVVKQKIATSIKASYSPFSAGPAMLTIRAVPAKNITMEHLEAAIDKTLSKAIIATPKETDITRAKTLLKAETLYAREGLQGVAYIVGWLTMLGLDTNYINQWPKEVDEATVTSMQQAARDTLNITNSVTGILLPQTKEAK